MKIPFIKEKQEQKMRMTHTQQRKDDKHYTEQYKIFLHQEIKSKVNRYLLKRIPFPKPKTQFEFLQNVYILQCWKNAYQKKFPSKKPPSFNQLKQNLIIYLQQKSSIQELGQNLKNQNKSDFELEIDLLFNFCNIFAQFWKYIKSSDEYQLFLETKQKQFEVIRKKLYKKYLKQAKQQSSIRSSYFPDEQSEWNLRRKLYNS